MGELDEQGEKLDNINKKLEEMDEDLTSAEEDVVKLNTCCGCGKPKKGWKSPANKKKFKGNYRKEDEEQAEGGKSGSKKKDKRKRGSIPMSERGRWQNTSRPSTTTLPPSRHRLMQCPLKLIGRTSNLK